MTVKAIFENGVLRPKTPLSLREHEEVEIEVKRTGETSPATDDDPTGWKTAERFIGLWKDAPRRSERSLSEDHDEVLYRRK
jgi:predicted DNA-binding antitoxin AbrB/MazE fold protein